MSKVWTVCRPEVRGKLWLQGHAPFMTFRKLGQMPLLQSVTALNINIRQRSLPFLSLVSLLARRLLHQLQGPL